MAGERPAFRPDIEGLRGLTILLVIAFHAGVSTVPGAFIAVDMFFVLSGFFITSLLLREMAAGELDLRAFYARRAVRLLPLLFVVLLTTLAAVMWLYAPIDRAAIAETARSAAFGTVNVQFAREGANYFFTEDNPLLHTWSLSVEQQFYVLWPLFVLVVAFIHGRSLGDHDLTASRDARSKLLLWIAVAGLLSFVFAVHLNGVSQPSAFFGLMTRIWEFALGSALAVLLVQVIDLRISGVVLQAAGFAAIAFSVAIYDRGMPHPGFITLLPTLGTAAVIVGGHRAPESWISRVLSAGILQWLGRVSYAWYLWHWPFVGIAVVLDPQIGVAGKLAWSMAALVVAWATYRFIERPARAEDGLRSRIPARWIGLAAFGASLTMAGVSHAAMKVGERQASSPSQRPFAAARNDRVMHNCWARTIEEVKGPCYFGDRQSSTTVVLIGDSHAEHWLGALDRIGRERGWKIELMVKGACPVAELRGLEASVDRHFRECHRYRDAMMRRIIATRPAAVVLSNADMYVPGNGSKWDWQVPPNQWRAALRRTYARLTSAGIPTVTMRDNPHTPFDIPRCLSRRAASLPRAGACDYELESALSPVGIALQNEAAKGLPIRFVDMTDRICSSARCPAVRDGIVVFTDDNHLTASFSRAVAPVLAERLDAALGQIVAR